MSVSAEAFMAKTSEVLEQIRSTQLDAIKQAGLAVATASRDGHNVWAFGTGHSHVIAEELYGRAGGWTDIRAVLEPSMMLHEGLAKSSAFERLSGVADALLKTTGVGEGDVVIVISNSGRNAVPVEFAAGAKERGATVVAITSLAHSKSVESRAPSGQRLFEVADIVIDNCGEPGDAVIELPGIPAKVAATSTIAGSVIAQAIVCEAAANFIEWGERPPVLMSNNVEGAEEYNAELLARLESGPR
jgi:uncharacterized phosphosugar-binding protein